RLGRRCSRAARCRNAGDALRCFGDLHAGDKALQIALLFGAEVAGLICRRGFEIDLGHSAGTRVTAASGADGASRGLWVRTRAKPVKMPPPTRLPSVTGI